MERDWKRMIKEAEAKYAEQRRLDEEKDREWRRQIAEEEK